MHTANITYYVALTDMHGATVVDDIEVEIEVEFTDRAGDWEILRIGFDRIIGRDLAGRAKRRTAWLDNTDPLYLMIERQIDGDDRFAEKVAEEWRDIRESAKSYRREVA